MQLRPYQIDAIDAVYRDLRSREDNLCVVIPTAGGKTPVIASICRDAVTRWGGRVLIVSHVKELLEQAADKLRAICPDVRYGVYSAGLGKRDLGRSVTIAGIQSVYTRACDVGAVDLTIVDEAHLIPPDGDGMYQTMFDEIRVVNPRMRVIGFTATPFRTRTGPLCSPDGILNHVSYEIGVRELIAQGYLSRLISKAGAEHVDTSGLHIRGGEFMADEVEDLMDRDALVSAACAEIVAMTAARSSVLIFASGVRHCGHVADQLERASGFPVARVTGDTPPIERAATLAAFKSREVKYLCNVNVLTTGFDAPNVDCVVLLRPMCSPVLYVQCVGRGFRLCDGKHDCLVLDYGGNVLRHGPVDDVRIERRAGERSGDAPAKECPQCRSIVAAGYTLCPDCGYEFPPPDRKAHDAKAGTAAILSGEVAISEYDVLETVYSVHVKRNAEPNTPKSMRVSYRVSSLKWVEEWICVEHVGYAAGKAAAWWSRRSVEPMPVDADEAVWMANAGALATTKRIKVRSVAGEKYDRITEYELGDVPPRIEGEERLPEFAASTAADVTDLDIPF